MLGHHTDAIKIFSKAIEKEPKNTKGYYSKALSLIQLNKNEEAIKELNQAVAIFPRDMSSQMKRYELYRKMGKLKEAESCYNEMIKLDPKLKEKLSPPS